MEAKAESQADLRAILAVRLRDKGLRVTQQRVAVLEYLLATPKHPTAEEVGAAVNRLVPTASRASIYNVLHSLRESGLIDELVVGDAVARYDANLDRHHHFICRACGAVEDVPFETFREAPRPRLADGHTVEDYTVTLRGVCPRCAKP
ncbi:MAG TPA: Fur family transcriptional regulator [Thermoanaerobaculia bacterium]